MYVNSMAISTIIPVYLNHFFWLNAENNFPHPKQPLPVTTKAAKKQMVAHGDLSSAASCRTNIPAKFQGIFEYFSRNFKIFA